MDSRLIQGIGMTSQRTRDRLAQRLEESGIRDQEVLNVIRVTPRHLFVDEALSNRSYEDTALPIGFGQTISQPWVVARMTELLLEGGPLKNVLEIGTGSGYQTAILAKLCGHVYSVERIKGLHDKARRLLRDLKFNNVTLKHSDGGLGWNGKGPFDGILAAAGRQEVPRDLLEQLAPGGRLIMPVGDDIDQELHLVVREGNEFVTSILDPVKFVPFLNGAI